MKKSLLIFSNQQSHPKSICSATWNIIIITVVPRDTSLIHPVTLLVRQFARISKQFSPLKLIEMPLIRSSPQNATPVVFVTCF